MAYQPRKRTRLNETQVSRTQQISLLTKHPAQSMAEQSSSVAATDPGPSRRGHRQAQLSCGAHFEVVDRLDPSVLCCTVCTSHPIHMVHTTSSARSAPNPPPHSRHHSARPPLSSRTPQNTTSNTSQGSTHTRSRRTVLLARGRSHHMLATGSGGTKLGRKDAGELLCLVKIRYSLKR